MNLPEAAVFHRVVLSVVVFDGWWCVAYRFFYVCLAGWFLVAWVLRVLKILRAM